MIHNSLTCIRANAIAPFSIMIVIRAKAIAPIAATTSMFNDSVHLRTIRNLYIYKEMWVSREVLCSYVCNSHTPSEQTETSSKVPHQFESINTFGCIFHMRRIFAWKRIFVTQNQSGEVIFFGLTLYYDCYTVTKEFLQPCTLYNGLTFWQKSSVSHLFFKNNRIIRTMTIFWCGLSIKKHHRSSPQ